MVSIDAKNLNIEKISKSGQCFRLREVNGKFALIAFGEYLFIEQQSDKVKFDCSKEKFDSIWSSYFDLETDYGKIEKSVKKQDLFLQKAVRFGSGIHILKQDLWEMIITFIISQQNNIKRIQKCIDVLCEKYGQEKKNKMNESYYAFPTAKALAGITEQDLRNCNLGYRAPYILSTAKKIATGEVDLTSIEKMEYEQAKIELLKLHGVGKKVADCICLFGLHQFEAFPIDTHINKILEKHYPKGFPFSCYMDTAGVMQQYLFYYDLWNV